MEKRCIWNWDHGKKIEYLEEKGKKAKFGKEPWCLYTGKHLLTFVDNHDVSRIASTLTNKAHLPLIYALMFGMPGIPCIYYGSEWGCEAVKGSGNDNILRPAFDKPEYNELKPDGH